jgi:hypothetical protein
MVVQNVYIFSSGCMAYAHADLTVAQLHTTTLVVNCSFLLLFMSGKGQVFVVALILRKTNKQL